MRIAVFASGGGTNFQAILDAIEAEQLPAQVSVCISNRPGAGALDRARRHEVPTCVLDPGAFADEASYCTALMAALDEQDTDFIALAGYMKRIPKCIVRRFQDRIVNIHPALLPAFGGKGMYGSRVHRAVIEHGARWTGATVHLVDEAYDTGPIVLQDVVPVEQEDTPESLAGRVLQIEHRLYPQALRLFAHGRIHVEGRRVLILPASKIS